MKGKYIFLTYVPVFSPPNLQEVTALTWCPVAQRGPEQLLTVCARRKAVPKGVKVWECQLTYDKVKLPFCLTWPPPC